MAGGEYQSSQGGVAPVSRDHPPNTTASGPGTKSDPDYVDISPARDGARQRNAAAGRSRAWPNTEPSGQDISGYAHEARKMP